jgi:serralysin
MAKNTYRGTNRADIVNQTRNNDWYNIITYAGDDIVNVRLTDTWVNAGAGNDTVTNKFEGGNKIDLGAGNDTYVGNGFASGGRFDEVFGGAGNDTMTVFTRQSDYYGDGGNDYISSSGYWNFLSGGKGNDTISYQAQDDDKFLRGWGVDLDLAAGVARTGQGRKEQIVGFENAEGTSVGDGIVGSGANNKLWGLGGNDDLYGMKGNDQLFGGAGADRLYGGNGADKLTGGTGADYLHGGSGNDTFIFNAVNEMGRGKNADVIADFSRGDKIDLSNAGSFTYINKADFSGTAGEIRFDNGLLQGDVDGDGRVDFVIKVTDVNSLSNSDFIL